MAMLLLPAVCFADRALRLFVAESLHRNIGKLKDGDSRTAYRVGWHTERSEV